ncbi:thylakoid lumenal 16.5 kDa protein, chloroplastic-like isoform X2 [Apium graveolens]|uniref:thylakoid lumenal 16.5 kDa protein, chloroplastic-like isoform X2 n=1 Tax=Apium graveolens TaxID=4045 RepID=UPI003D793B3C
MFNKLSKLGQAIEKNDLPTAASVLSEKSDAEWVQKTNAALVELSSSPEKKADVDTVNSSLSTLILSGLTYLVYPGAVLSRFEHLLGVYWLAGETIHKINIDQGSELGINKFDIQTVKLAVFAEIIL